MKSYTTVEQSKKLAKILPLESADAFYVTAKEPVEIFPIFGFITYEHLKEQTTHKRAIPCWSLAALLSVLPRIDIEKEMWSDDTYDYRVKAYIDDGYIGDYFDNPVDACYDMIITLNKDKLL